jgi:hypothetical protein
VVPCPRVCAADLSVFLKPTDPEADIFVGLTSLQIHRRAKTLGRVAELVAAGRLTLRTMRDIIVSLALHMLHDAVRDPTQTRVRSTDQGNLAGMHARATEVLGAVAAHLAWGPYLSLLRTVLIEVRPSRAHRLGCRPLPWCVVVTVYVCVCLDVLCGCAGVSHAAAAARLCSRCHRNH